MRIAELSHRTRVPVATIKYYRREGLLPPGEHTRPNQAQYGEEHVRRIRLIRALVEVGGLPIAAVRDVLAAIDTRAASVHYTLGAALHGMIPLRTAPAGETWVAASQQVEDLMRRRGWHRVPHSPALRTATAVLATLRELGETDFVQGELLEVYADAVEQVAAFEVELISSRTSVDSIVEGAVVGTVLGETLIAALRHLAHEAASARVFGLEPKAGAGPAGDASPG